MMRKSTTVEEQFESWVQDCELQLDNVLYRKEEDVHFNGVSSILFKVILEEKGNEKKKYLDVDFVQK